MNEEINKGNASAFGEFSVLTPSQKRALGKAEEEKQEKESAKKRKREEEKFEKERQTQAKKSLYIIVIAVSVTCALGWTIYGALQEYNFLLGVGVGIVLAIPAIYGWRELADSK